MKTKKQKQEELAKKRAEEVKETKSIRLNRHDLAIVEKKAAAKDMKTSTYIAYAAVQGCDGVTPAIKVSVQNIINHAADALEQFAPEEAQKIRMEGNSIWDL